MKSTAKFPCLVEAHKYFLNASVSPLTPTLYGPGGGPPQQGGERARPHGLLFTALG